MGNEINNQHPVECIMKERWAVQEIVNQQNGEKLEKIEECVTDTHKRLFVGNGSPSLAMRVDRSEATLRIVCWLGAILGATVVGFAAEKIITLLTHSPK